MSTKLYFPTFFFFFISIYLQAQAIFTDVSVPNGIGHVGKNHGAAIADFNNDGLDDIYAFGTESTNILYQNMGNGTFIDVAEAVGVNHTGTSYMCLWGDVDNDGQLDLFVGNRDEAHVLYHNNGDGTFSDISESAGIQMGDKTRAVLFGDVDNDGFIDLYLARLGQPNILYKNNGDLTFSDWTTESGALDSQISMGALFLDYDNDNDLDLYLSHDANQPNILYQNDGNGVFTDVSEASNANYAGQGMGVDFGDVNNDGWLDIYITNLNKNTLLQNNGDGTFSNISEAAGITDIGMGWGISWLDFDNDGWQDIYMVNDSYFSPNPNILYQNMSDNTFSIASEGTPLHSMEAAYGVACTDYNNDGRVDIYLINKGGETGNQLFRNDNINENNWVKIKTKGTASNYAGIGTRVLLEAGGMIFTDAVTAGSGYASQNSLTLHLGLGKVEMIDKMTVYWSSGLVEVFENIAVNKNYVIVEGESISTGIKQLEEQVINLSLTPNPFHDFLKIQLNSDKISDVDISIFNVNGLMMMHQKINNSQSIELNVKDLPRGLYFCQIQTKKQNFVYKMLKD